MHSGRGQFYVGSKWAEHTGSRLTWLIPCNLCLQGILYQDIPCTGSWEKLLDMRCVGPWRSRYGDLINGLPASLKCWWNMMGKTCVFELWSSKTKQIDWFHILFGFKPHLWGGVGNLCRKAFPPISGWFRMCRCVHGRIFFTWGKHHSSNNLCLESKAFGHFKQGSFGTKHFAITSKTKCPFIKFMGQWHMFKQTRAASCMQAMEAFSKSWHPVCIFWPCQCGLEFCQLHHPRFIYYFFFSWDICHGIIPNPSNCE